MSIVKLAYNQQFQNPQQPKQGGIAGWSKRHPLLAGGVALTAGIAGADVLTGMYKNKVDGKALMNNWKNHLKEGAVYGAGLSAVEPLVLHGMLKKKVEE